ncbi:MAG: hypothetical protein U0T83_04715 [Bacteriovoracaceae bacterium]
MKRKPPKPPKKNDDEDNDFSGFEEIMDLVKKPEPTIQSIKSDTAKFDLINFLEKESLRLNAQNDFFTKKTNMLKNYDQLDKIISNQELIRDNIRDDLVKLLNKSESNFHKNLDQIFLNAFLVIN